MSLITRVKAYGLLMVIVIVFPEYVIPAGTEIALQLGTGEGIGVGDRVAVGVDKMGVADGIGVLVGGGVGVGVPEITS